MRRLVLFSDMYFGSPTLERSRFSCARLRRPNLRRRLGEWAGMAGACAGARDVVVGWQGFFGRHCVPSAASRLSLMDFFYAQFFWSTLDLSTESSVKCFWQIWDQFVGLKSDLVPWCKVSTSFCQARLRFLSRGNVEKSKSGFFTIFRVQPPTTHDRGIFTYPGWNQWNEISAHLWTKLRHVRYMFSWHERTQIHMYMTECPTSLRMMSQGSRAYT